MAEILIILLLIVLNGIFAMSEIAVISARKSSLTADGKKGNRAARIALKLSNEPDRYLSTIQIGITLIGILTGIYSGAKLSDDFAAFLESTCGISPRYADEAAQITIVTVVTYLTLIFGELFPKRIGMSAAEKVSKAVARPMYYLSVIASPFVWVLAKSTAFIFRLFGLKDEDSKVTEQEIRTIVEEGKADGAVLDVEQDIVERVFLMGDMTVEMLMTHRADLVTLDVSMNADEVKKVLSSRLCQLYPVVDKSLDNIIGVVRLKDLVLRLDDPDLSLREICAPPTAFHENMSVYTALERMKADGASSALVFDEFGACQGVIALRDILEGLVGQLGVAGAQAEITEREDKQSWLVDGQCAIYDFLHYFDVDDLRDECSSFATVSGLILKLLGRIPDCGDTVEWKMFRFEVVDMDGVRIDKLLVVRKEEGNPE